MRSFPQSFNHPFKVALQFDGTIISTFGGSVHGFVRQVLSFFHFLFLFDLFKLFLESVDFLLHDPSRFELRLFLYPKLYSFLHCTLHVSLSLFHWVAFGLLEADIIIIGRESYLSVVHKG